jgi:hypothetical protein
MGREMGDLDGFRRVRVASGVYRDAEADAQPRGGAAALVDHGIEQVERLVRVVLVGQGVELRLDPYRSVCRGVLDHLTHQPQKDLPGAVPHQPRRCPVQGEEVLERPEAAYVRRSFSALGRQFGERGGAHRPFKRR